MGFLKKVAVGFIGFFLLLGIIGMIVGPQDTQHKTIEKPKTNTTEVKETVNTVKNTTTENKTEVKLIDGLFEDEYMNATYNMIKGYNKVRDVAIKRDGNTVSIAIVVDYDISEEYAKEIAEDAVRGVMSFSIDDSPAVSFPEGLTKDQKNRWTGYSKFDYLVGVYTPDGTQVVLGAKSADSYLIAF